MLRGDAQMMIVFLVHHRHYRYLYRYLYRYSMAELSLSLYIYIYIYICALMRCAGLSLRLDEAGGWSQTWFKQENGSTTKWHLCSL